MYSKRGEVALVTRGAPRPLLRGLWLAPIHYVLEGLIVTQFHGANQQVKGAPGFPPGEEPTLSRYYTSHWNDGWFGGYFVWSHRFQNMIILVAFILFFRFATFYALERINYATR